MATSVAAELARAPNPAVHNHADSQRVYNAKGRLSVGVRMRRP
ncbi:MAG: hypothetical protein ABSC10_13580 [Candidatus Acidiferrales bacterium]